MKAQSSNPDHPITRLDPADLDMITTFVLESGSIKALARHYDVSYPTIRNRLDELIDRVRAVVDAPRLDPLTDYLASLIERGRIAPDVARRIRDLHDEASGGRAPVSADSVVLLAPAGRRTGAGGTS